MTWVTVSNYIASLRALCHIFYFDRDYLFRYLLLFAACRTCASISPTLGKIKPYYQDFFLFILKQTKSTVNTYQNKIKLYTLQDNKLTLLRHVW